jgi:hypothetical protein
MSWKAKDGKSFPSSIQQRKYDRYLDEQRVQTQVDRGKQDIENAPGGERHEADLREHGVTSEAHIVSEGNGRWRLTTKHADGYESTSVHPQWFRAHELAGKYFDPDGKPGALETHQRARSHPVGKKEDERLASEDGRGPYSSAEDFSDER